MRLKSERIYDLQRQERMKKIESERKRKLQQGEIKKAVRDELQRQKFGPPNIRIPNHVTLIDPNRLDESRDEKCRIYREMVRRLSKRISRRDYLQSEMDDRKYKLEINKRLVRQFC